MFRKNYHTYTLTTQLRCIKGGEEYVDYIIQSASNYHISIPRYEAETIAKIITIYHTVGETVALQTFDSFVSGIIESYTDSTAMTASMRIPFYTGLLITNGVLNETEAAMYNDMALERQIQFLKEHGKIEN